MTETADLVPFAEMYRAIAEAHEIAVVKDFRGRALLLEHYAQIANNEDAERQAAEIRVHASTKCGVLVKLMQSNGELAQGGDRKSKSRGTTLKTLSDIGLNRDKSSKFQKLADIPKDEYDGIMESYRRNGEKPTENGVLRRAGKTPQPLEIQGDYDALAIWGMLPELAAHLSSKPITELAEGCDEVMRPRILELCPPILNNIAALLEELRK